MKLKQKALIIILMMLFGVPYFSSVGKVSAQSEPKINILEKKERPIIRSPISYDIDMEVESVNNTLSIMFSGYLPDANITVTDANGTLVIQQTLVIICTGTTFYVSPDDSYPYDIMITSPALDIVGQIINE